VNFTGRDDRQRFDEHKQRKTKLKTISTTFLVSRTIVSILFRNSKHYRHWWNACEKQVHKVRRTSELNLEC